MDHVVSVADDDQRQLVVEFGLFEEVLHPFRIVAVRLATDSLHFFDLARAGRRLQNTCMRTEY